MAALWRWHAAEENEHKAVAYDVYLAAGGNWRERVVVMAVATVIFWARVLQQQGHLMHADGTLWSVGEWSALFRYLFVNPGGLRKLFLPYLAWYRPDFHPNDLDTDALLNAWREEFRTSPIYQRAG
jgi:predicted metal-dependent hydrolase